MVKLKTVEYWKQNAEENYLTTPISVLKYITVLEEQAEQLRKHAVVGRSEQLSLCQCDKPSPDIMYGKTCTECCLEINPKA
jgi:hypothetical protein